MRRHALGVLSAVLLLTALGGWWRYGWQDSQSSVLISVCQRVGLVLGACWLAYPQLVVVLSRTSLWFVLLMGGVGLMILVRPRTAIVLGPAMLVLVVLQFIGWLIRPPQRRVRRAAREDD
ncbi:MAG: hypothetical protein MUF48_24095 [Pirellulaceae bacterium]|nr:hypothetical protein [Pirellulaceae bacterium]